jgi:hypothetical protein
VSGEQTIRRLVRRETHSSRAAASVVSAAVLAAMFLWLALEAVLALLGEDALLARPGHVGRWLGGIPAATVPTGLVAAGTGVALLGLLLLCTALRGGRRPRRALDSGRNAVVVDDVVIAAAISARARLTAGLAPGQVTTTVGRRTATVLVRPTSGVPADRATISAAVEGELTGYALGRRLAPRVTVSREGVLGQ